MGVGNVMLAIEWVCGVYLLVGIAVLALIIYMGIRPLWWLPAAAYWPYALYLIPRALRD
jgi:hypothetical protein